MDIYYNGFGDFFDVVVIVVVVVLAVAAAVVVVVVVVVAVVVVVVVVVAAVVVVDATITRRGIIGIGNACHRGKMATLLNSVRFVFIQFISFLPKCRVNYYYYYYFKVV